MAQIDERNVRNFVSQVLQENLGARKKDLEAVLATGKDIYGVLAYVPDYQEDVDNATFAVVWFHSL